MKGLVLCAGRGTRLQPFTFARSKCLIPVNGEPVIVSIIGQMVRMGIHEIGIVLNASQGPVRELLGNGDAYGASLTYLMQENALGLADAVKSAKSFLQDDPFFLMLGDNLIEGSLKPLIDLLGNHNAAAIYLARVNNPEQFGIASVYNNRIIRLEEKPKNPSSDLAIVGAYAFNKEIWEVLANLKPSKRGEYELTDAIQLLIDQGHPVVYSITTEPFFDIGSPKRWLEVNRYKMNKDMKNQNMIAFQQTNVTIHPPVHIDPSAKVINSTIGPYVYMGPGSEVSNSHIENSILTDHVHLSNISAIDSIFGSHVDFSGSPDDRKPATYIIGDKSLMKDV